MEVFEVGVLGGEDVGEDDGLDFFEVFEYLCGWFRVVCDGVGDGIVYFYVRELFDAGDEVVHLVHVHFG